MGGLFKIGDGTTQRSISKTVVIPHTLAKPTQSTMAVNVGVGWVQPNLMGSTQLATQPLTLPAGVTLQSVEMSIYQKTTADRVTADLLKHRVLEGTFNSSLQTLLSFATTVNGTWEPAGSTTMTELIDSDYSYGLDVNLWADDSGSTALKLVSDARYAYVRATYTMPSYDKGI